jgi:hypothetical protein
MAYEVDWTTVTAESRTNGRGDSPKMRAFIKGALLRPDLSGSKLGERLGGMKYTPAPLVRQVLSVLIEMGDEGLNVRHEGEDFVTIPAKIRDDLLKQNDLLHTENEQLHTELEQCRAQLAKVTPAPAAPAAEEGASEGEAPLTGTEGGESAAESQGTTEEPQPRKKSSRDRLSIVENPPGRLN